MQAKTDQQKAAFESKLATVLAENTNIRESLNAAVIERDKSTLLINAGKETLAAQEQRALFLEKEIENQRAVSLELKGRVDVLLAELETAKMSGDEVQPGTQGAHAREIEVLKEDSEMLKRQIEAHLTKERTLAERYVTNELVSLITLA